MSDSQHNANSSFRHSETLASPWGIYMEGCHGCASVVFDMCNFWSNAKVRSHRSAAEGTMEKKQSIDPYASRCFAGNTRRLGFFQTGALYAGMVSWLHLVCFCACIYIYLYIHLYFFSIPFCNVARQERGFWLLLDVRHQASRYPRGFI